MQSELFTVDGQKVVNVRITNDTIKFLKECVNWFIDGKYGDADDPRQKETGPGIKRGVTSNMARDEPH